MPEILKKEFEWSPPKGIPETIEGHKIIDMPRTILEPNEKIKNWPRSEIENLYQLNNTDKIGDMLKSRGLSIYDVKDIVISEEEINFIFDKFRLSGLFFGGSIQNVTCWGIEKEKTELENRDYFSSHVFNQILLRFIDSGYKVERKISENGNMIYISREQVGFKSTICYEEMCTTLNRDLIGILESFENDNSAPSMVKSYAHYMKFQYNILKFSGDKTKKSFINYSNKLMLEELLHNTAASKRFKNYHIPLHEVVGALTVANGKMQLSGGMIKDSRDITSPENWDSYWIMELSKDSKDVENFSICYNKIPSMNLEVGRYLSGFMVQNDITGRWVKDQVGHHFFSFRKDRNEFKVPENLMYRIANWSEEGEEVSIVGAYIKSIMIYVLCIR